MNRTPFSISTSRFCRLFKSRNSPNLSRFNKVRLFSFLFPEGLYLYHWTIFRPLWHLAGFWLISRTFLYHVRRMFCFWQKTDILSFRVGWLGTLIQNILHSIRRTSLEDRFFIWLEYHCQYHQLDCWDSHSNQLFAVYFPFLCLIKIAS